MQALSVVIISYNEALNIGRCIRSVRAVADEIIVVDSFSDDDTVSIAVSLGARVEKSKFNSYVTQKNKAISLASHDFILLLDADEALDSTLAASIFKEKQYFSFHAYTMNRCSSLCGKFIRHGLWYPDSKLRLFNKALGNCAGLDPHDKIEMQAGIRARHLKGDILHYAFESVEEYLERNNEVSCIAARSLFEAGIKKPWTKIIFSPVWAFINGYFLRMGFLDGRLGYIIAVYTAKQSFVKYLRLRQLQKEAFKKIIWE